MILQSTWNLIWEIEEYETSFNERLEVKEMIGKQDTMLKFGMLYMLCNKIVG